MSHGGEVERYVKDPSLLVELCREVIERLDAGSDNGETAAMEAQLREIARAIDKLDKQGVPVPDALRAEKTRLAAALAVKDENVLALSQLSDGLSELLREVRARLQPRQPYPQRDKRPQAERANPERLPRSVLREAIIEALQSLGGRAFVQNVYDAMERQLADCFLPGDLKWLEPAKGKWKGYSWQISATEERRKMIDEGILCHDSPRGIWELSEEAR